ncbi:hypothetical protein O1611_g876 [Lasiodiplodia mahajangana]|uniref:Uncharacterized protein n=1 Tax=Lasiodiplodia mahajangana TaxID=1108764 RepID=A0ACC2JZ45_9PEZI|nr:hypothetical protein O1611_g876 [Lasiodiplodia mahajangana]
MDESSAVQRLTKANLSRLQFEISRLDSLPKDELKRAKYDVWGFLCRLSRIGSEANRICAIEDVYVTGTASVGYRGNAVPAPDVQDPGFWQTKLQDLEAKYRRTLDFKGTKRSVYLRMRQMNRYGREGYDFLAGYELYIAGDKDIRYRGNRNPEPNLQDVTYWKEQRDYLESKYWKVQHAWHKRRRQESGIPEAPTLNTEEKEEMASTERREDYISNWPKREKEIELWVDNTQDTGDGLSEPCSPVFHGLSDLASLDGIEGSVGRPVGINTRTGRSRLARLSVYDRMVALWDLGGEGREIIKNDELHVAGRFDICYKRDRIPRPNLQDPTYWEAKLEYFTGKLVSLLRDRYKEDDSSLSPWVCFDDEDRDRLPIPSRASDVSSSAFSIIPDPRPSPASVRAFEVLEEQRYLYGILKEDFFENEGRQILENDEIYIAGPYDVRYRWKSGPMPDLQDPKYWRQKKEYFRLQHIQSLGPVSHENPNWPSYPKKNDTQAPAIESLVRETAPAQNPITPQSGVIDTQATESPEGSKRKRDIQLDDMSQCDSRGTLHPTKRRKSSARQANGICTEGSPTAAAPQHRRKQRKTYEKVRSSRRIAGQPPEFGLLPERGDEPQPYEDLTQHVSPYISTMSNPSPRSRRRPNKPTEVKGAKPRGIPKPVQERAGRPRRPRRG